MDQLAVARWACFKDIEFVLARDDREHVTDGTLLSTPAWVAEWRERLGQLRATRRPPADWHCRMVAFRIPGGADDNEAGKGLDRRRSKPMAPAFVREGQHHLRSFMPVGGVAFEGVFADQDWIRKFRDATRHDRRFLNIWPTHGATVTAPRSRIVRSEWEQLLTDWSHVPQNAWSGGIILATE